MKKSIHAACECMCVYVKKCIHAVCVYEEMHVLVCVCVCECVNKTNKE